MSLSSPTSNFIAALEKAVRVRRRYESSFDGEVPEKVKLRLLRNLISDATGYNVKLRQVSWNGMQLRGRLEPYEREGYKQAIIDYGDWLNRCWRRFTIAKELAQLLVMEPDSSVRNSEEAIELIADLVHPPPMTQLDDIARQFASERIAVDCATHLCFPIDTRNRFIDLIDREEITIYQVAVAHRIPENVVEAVLDREYHAEMLELWKDITAD